VRGGTIDLARRDSSATVEADPALVVVASALAEVFQPHAIQLSSTPSGVPTLNPLYVAEAEGDRVCLRLTFPSAAYEDEFGACRAYLPETVTVSRAAMMALAEGRLVPEIADLTLRRVVLTLPGNYC